MSVASEITRLQGIKSDIQTALVAKGITSASTHDMADFAEDIGDIQAGGHTSLSATAVYEGTNQNNTYTVTSDGKYLAISFGNASSTATTDINSTGNILIKSRNDNISLASGKRSLCYALIDCVAGNTISNTSSYANYNDFVIFQVNKWVTEVEFVTNTSDSSKATLTTGQISEDLLVCMATAQSSSMDGLCSITPSVDLMSGRKYKAGIGRNNSYTLKAEATGSFAYDVCMRISFGMKD